MFLLEMCTELYVQSQQTHSILGSDVTFLEFTCQHFREKFWLSLQNRQYLHRLIYQLHSVISHKAVVFTVMCLQYHVSVAAVPRNKKY